MGWDQALSIAAQIGATSIAIAGLYLIERLAAGFDREARDEMHRMANELRENAREKASHLRNLDLDGASAGLEQAVSMNALHPSLKDSHVQNAHNGLILGGISIDDSYSGAPIDLSSCPLIEPAQFEGTTKREN